jgi:hypothetical protein
MLIKEIVGSPGHGFKYNFGKIKKEVRDEITSFSMWDVNL